MNIKGALEVEEGARGKRNQILMDKQSLMFAVNNNFV